MPGTGFPFHDISNLLAHAHPKLSVPCRTLWLGLHTMQLGSRVQRKGYFLLLTQPCLLMVFQYCQWIFFSLSHMSLWAPQATHTCRWAGEDLSDCNKTQIANYECLSHGSQVMTACCQKYLYWWVCCSLCPLYSFLHLFWWEGLKHGKCL